MQLALYARANNVQQAVLAYLRAEELHVFAEQQLEEAFEQASSAAAGITAGKFGATPGPTQCRICEYSSICGFAQV